MKKLIWGIMIVFLFCFPVSTEAQTYSFSASKVVIKTGSKKEIPVYSGKKKVKADLFKWKSSNKGIVPSLLRALYVPRRLEVRILQPAGVRRTFAAKFLYILRL